MKLLRYMMLSLVLCLSTWVQAAPLKVTEIEGVSEYRLPNGLKVLLAPDVTKASISVNITYLVGSRHEGSGETGMAHLLEHLLFKGTPRIPNLPDELSRRGMSPNGMTSSDRTVYFETFAANDDYLQWALEMEADRMVNAYVAEKDLRTEMTVVRNEMERGENSVGNVLRQLVLATAYQWHGYGRSTIGARSDVENVDIPRLQAFYRQYYQPDNALLTVAGNFDPVKTLALIESTFAPIPKPTRVLPRLYTVEPAQEGERTVRLERVGENRLLNVLYHIPAAAHPDSSVLDVLSQVLGDTPTGRLHQHLVNTGIATYAYGRSASQFDPGYALFGVQLAKNGDVDAARKALLDVLEGTASTPITEAEVDAARRAILASYEKTANDTSRLAMALSSAAGAGDWRLYFWQRDQLAQVDAAAVNRVAQQYFRASNRTVGEFIPVEKSEKVLIPSTPDIQQQLADYKGKALGAAGEAFDATPTNIAARTQTTVLKNGMQLALLSKKTRGQTVRATLQLNFGTQESLQGQSFASAFTAALLKHGTAKHSRDELARELDHLRSQIDINGSGASVLINISSVRENLPATLRLLREILREPTLPKKGFDLLRAQTQSALEGAKQDPGTLANMALAQQLDDYAKNDVRYEGSVEEQLAALHRLALGDVQAFYRRFYAADHAQFAVVGDFDAAEINQLMAELFGDWKSKEPWQRLPQAYKAVDASKKVLTLPDKQNAIFRAALRLPLGAEHPDYLALAVASRIFGGGFLNSRMAARLRQKEGISYSASAWLSVERNVALGEFSAYAIYAPQYRDKLEQAFFEEIVLARQEGFTQQEVSDAVNGILNSLVLSHGQDASLAGILVDNLYYEQDWARSIAIEEKLRHISVAEVNKAFKKYINPEAFTQVFVGDFSKSPQIINAKN